MSSFDMSLLNDKLDYVFKGLKCTAKVNLAIGFVLENIEDGMCRYFHAHENNTNMEKAKLVCTQADMSNLLDRMQYSRKSQYKVEILQTDKCDNFCSATQRYTHGL